MSRLPVVGQDNNDWGNVLNDYLAVSLNTDGTIKTAALSAKIGLASGSPTAVTSVWVGDQTAYNLLTPDANTLYFIQ